MILDVGKDLFGQPWDWWCSPRGSGLCWRIAGLSSRPFLLVASFLTAFLVMRSVLGIPNYNVRNRYISYLWPSIIMVWLPALLMTFEPQIRRMRARGTHVYFASATVCFLGLTALGTLIAAQVVVTDTQEMIDVVVEPSQWMAANLPKDAVIAMEPAGALRTFTDFQLVDRVGLTTMHFRDYQLETGKAPSESYADFFKVNRIQYIFDYPDTMHYPDGTPWLRQDVVTVEFWVPEPEAAFVPGKSR